MSINSADILILTNLCYIIKEDRVLLQKKSRGFGKGKWNAPGGKIEKSESIIDSVFREVKEETSLKIKNPQLIGFHEFLYENKPEWNTRTYIFKVFSYIGEEHDMGEGELKWFSIKNLPLSQMWDDDRFWTEKMLLGHFRNTRFFFDEFGKYLKQEFINNN